MAKSNGNRNHGKAKDDFKKVAPWDDKLPEVQILPEVSTNQFCADDDLAKQLGPDDPRRLKLKTFVIFAEALAADAEKVAPGLRSIYETVKNLAWNDIVRARTEEFNKLNPEQRKRYKVPDDPKIIYKDGGIKSIPRIIKKALDEYGGKFQKIRDVARCAIEGQTPEEVAALCVVMEWMKKNDFELPGGAKIVEVENRFRTSTGTRYRSLKAIVAIPIEGGPRPYHLAEIMIRHKGFEKDVDHDIRKGKHKRVSHEIYSLVRSFEERFKNLSWPMDIYNKYIKHWRDVVSIHDEATEKHGIGEGVMLGLFRKFWGMRTAAAGPLKGPENRGLDHD